MMTWFDILLVTLLAATTALGVRRGLAGLAWGVGGVVIIFLANALHLGALPALLAALILGALLNLGVRRLIAYPLDKPWHLAAGALGGVLLGSVLVVTLALSFPLALKGKQAVYPSPDLSAGLYRAVADSSIQKMLLGIWSAPRPVRTLFIPDRS